MSVRVHWLQKMFTITAEINAKVQEIADKYKVTTYQVKDGGTQKWNNEYNQIMQELFDFAKQKAFAENKTLFTFFKERTSTKKKKFAILFIFVKVFERLPEICFASSSLVIRP